MSASEIAVIALTETNAAGYGLGTLAQTYTSIDNLATKLVYFMEGNNTHTATDSDSTQDEVFLFILLLSLSAAFFKALFYFFNAEVTNRILFSSWISTEDKPRDLEAPNVIEEATESVDSGIMIESQEGKLEEITSLVAKTQAQENSCTTYSNQAKPYFRTAGQLYGSFLGIALPNGGSMLLQTLTWGVPFAPAVVIAGLTMATNLVSIYSILKFGDRQNPTVRKQTAEQLQAAVARIALDNSKSAYMPAKKMIVKGLTYFCALGYGAGTAIQAFTLNQKLTKDLFSVVENDENDTHASSILAWFYSFLFFNVITSLCKGESYIYNALTATQFLLDDLFSIPEMEVEVKKTESPYSKLMGYFATLRQILGALGATAVPNGGSIYLQASGVGLEPATAGVLGGATLVTTGFSMYGLFKHGTRPRETPRQEETILEESRPGLIN